MSASGDEPEFTALTRETLGTSVVNWLLVDGSRFVVASGVLGGVLGVFAALQAAGAISVTGNTTPLLYAFSTLAGANITLVTVIVSINQLVLSRELRSPGELREEIRATIEYRNDVEGEAASPVVTESPADFLGVLVRRARYRAQSLEEAPVDDEALQARIDGLAGSLIETLAALEELLDRPQIGLLSTLTTILDEDFSRPITYSRWVRQRHAQTLPASVAETLGDVEARMEQLDVARQYLKTVYIQEELSQLSRLLFYVGLPSVVVSVAMLLVYTQADAGVGPRTLAFATVAAITAGFAPLAVLLAYVVRIATVAQRTVAITPFRSTDR